MDKKLKYEIMSQNSSKYITRLQDWIILPIVQSTIEIPSKNHWEILFNEIE